MPVCLRVCRIKRNYIMRGIEGANSTVHNQRVYFLCNSEHVYDDVLRVVKCGHSVRASVITSNHTHIRSLYVGTNVVTVPGQV